MSAPSTPRGVARAVEAMHSRLNAMADALEARPGYLDTEAEHAVNRAISALEDAYLALGALAREGGQ